jgi:hypothetical protein
MLVKKQIEILNLQSYDGFVHFPEVLWSCMSIIYGINRKEVIKNKLQKRILKNLEIKY